MQNQNGQFQPDGVDSKGRRYWDDFFVYNPLVFSALAAGATLTQNIAIQADSDFCLQKLSYNADIAAATQTDSARVVPLITTLITDSGSGRQLMNTDIPVPGLFGLGNQPFILPKPKWFAANSNIAVKVTSFVAAGTTYNLYLNFIGFKRFYLN